MILHKHGLAVGSINFSYLYKPHFFITSNGPLIIWRGIDNNLSKINSLSQFMGGRYNAVNLESYRKYGTAEFRQHGGSINADKVCNWVIFCTHLC